MWSREVISRYKGNRYTYYNGINAAKISLTPIKGTPVVNVEKLARY